MGQSMSPSTLVSVISRSSDRSVEWRCNVDCIPTVYVADADAVCWDLMRTTGWQTQVLESLEALAQGPRAPVPSCLILDISRHGIGDFGRHECFTALRAEVPIICTAGDVDLGTVVKIVKAGAFDVLRKPIASDLLLDAVHRALHHSEVTLKEEFEVRQIRNRYASLSQRERQVMALIGSGLLNKQVGGELGISEITVKAHRGRLMRKMQARSFAGLVKMATALNL